MYCLQPAVSVWRSGFASAVFAVSVRALAAASAGIEFVELESVVLEFAIAIAVFVLMTVQKTVVFVSNQA